MQRINTIPVPETMRRDAHPNVESHELMRDTDEAVTRALRRVGGEAWQNGTRSGQRIDPRRMPFAAYPDSRMFQRIVSERTGHPRTGLCTLIDSSGSMGAQCTANGKTMVRRHAARAMACGFASAAQRCGIGFTAAHHGVGMDEAYAAGAKGGSHKGMATVLRVDVHRTTRTILNGPRYSDNWDAFAVWHLINSVEMPAEHTLFVLICDGEPTINPARHSKMAEAAIRRLEQKGHRFAFAYIGNESEESLKSSARDWGARRIINCTKDLQQLTTGIVTAMRSIV
jgi:hypothetical protein